MEQKKLEIYLQFAYVLTKFRFLVYSFYPKRKTEQIRNSVENPDSNEYFIEYPDLNGYPISCRANIDQNSLDPKKNRSNHGCYKN